MEAKVVSEMEAEAEVVIEMGAETAGCGLTEAEREGNNNRS
jgi:hypothetical protein